MSSLIGSIEAIAVDPVGAVYLTDVPTFSALELIDRYIEQVGSRA